MRRRIAEKCHDGGAPHRRYVCLRCESAFNLAMSLWERENFIRHNMNSNIMQYNWTYMYINQVAGCQNRHRPNKLATLLWPWMLTSNFGNLFSNAQWCVKYLCKVSSKSIHCASRHGKYVLQYNTIQYNGQFSAQPTTKTERLGITMLINDESQLKRNVKQIVFSLRFKLARVSTDLTDSGRLFHTDQH